MFICQSNLNHANLCKNFFVQKPTRIKEVDVIKLTAPQWLPILRDELAMYPDALVIALGQPIMRFLATSGSQHMRDYWGYVKVWQTHPEKLKPMSAIEADNSVLNRRIFPIPHQPTLGNKGNKRGNFYRHRLSEYIDFCLRTHQG
jgi:hypothetical protein